MRRRSRALSRLLSHHYDRDPRKKKSRKKSAKKRTSSSRSAAARKAWRTRRAKYGKSGTKKSRRSKKRSSRDVSRDRGWWKQPKRHARAAKAGWGKRRTRRRSSYYRGR